MNNTAPAAIDAARATIQLLMQELTTERNLREQAVEMSANAVERLVAELGADAIGTAIRTTRTLLEELEENPDVLDSTIKEMNR